MDVMKRRIRSAISSFTSEPDLFLARLQRQGGAITGIVALDILMGKWNDEKSLHLVFRKGEPLDFVDYLTSEHSYQGGEVEERLPTDVGRVWRCVVFSFLLLIDILLFYPAFLACSFLSTGGGPQKY